LVTVKDNVQSVQKPFKLEIGIEPRSCDEGIRSNGKNM
jgi:hypothetical protein